VRFKVPGSVLGFKVPGSIQRYGLAVPPNSRLAQEPRTRNLEPNLAS